MYRELRQDQQTKILRERVLNLEADHFRLRLALDEEGDETERATILERITECERRIAVHSGGVVDTKPEPPDEDSPLT